MECFKTDLYQLTMMAAQFKKGLTQHVVSCEAFLRKLPPERKFLIMAGTEEIRKFLLDFKFSKDDINFLKELPQLSPVFTSSNFDKFLEDFSFSGDMWALSEGEIAFAGEPLVRITGTLPEVHMAETFILSVLNHDIKIASKAARIVLAARGKNVLEFGTRRTHHEAAISVARSAYLSGFSATSNVEAGRKYRIPVAGTMSHMWIMTNQNEETAFQDFKDVYKSPVLLIDTYDTENGAHLASKINSLAGVRLDSGDLLTLSRKVRKILDENKCENAKIIVSNDLNEYSINHLTSNNAPIDTFAVGTELAVSKDVPSLGIVYKVVYDDTNKKPLIKLASNKSTMPGRKEVFHDLNKWAHIVALEGELKPAENFDPLLECYIHKGESVEENVIDLETARKYCNSGLVNLPNYLADLSNQGVVSSPVYPHESLKIMFDEAVNGLANK